MILLNPIDLTPLSCRKRATAFPGSDNDPSENWCGNGGGGQRVQGSSWKGPESVPSGRRAYVCRAPHGATCCSTESPKGGGEFLLRGEWERRKQEAGSCPFVRDGCDVIDPTFHRHGPEAEK